MPPQNAQRWGALAAVVCSLLLASLLSHGVRQALESAHDHSAHGSLAICFAVAALLAPLGLALAPPRDRPRVWDMRVPPRRTEPRAFYAIPSRTTQAWLQRFRN